MNNANYKIYLPYADYNQYHQDNNDDLGSQLRIMLLIQDMNELKTTFHTLINIIYHLASSYSLWLS